ncbi:hypothetical protein OUM_0210 [Helicobacter pylori R038b]|uniref:Uncharacterized protein n=1 Tax=Helicobacter pylori R038b TaxID=1145115 RepID=K2KBE6_HELPX|nr:hypothetical protein OUM_0210 [Helicobacter pylori R038b]
MGLRRALKHKIPPYFLTSLNKLNEFYYKMESKTMKERFKPYFLKFLKDIKVG